MTFPKAVHHEAEIEVTFAGVPGATLEIVMSRSSPGRYALAEFAKNIYHVRANEPDGRELPMTHPDPYSWRVTGHHGKVVFRYTLFGNHLDGTYAAIDETHAHLNMPAAFAWARGFAESSYRFRFQPPAGSGWTVATQLFPHSDGSFSAPNLEQMMDSPVELSRHAWIEWQLDGAQFRLSLHHQGTESEAQQYASMCQAIVMEEQGVFGRLPKYDGGTYTFLADYLPYASGDGMEHRDSTVMTGAATLHSAMRQLAGTAAHEFFHSWNVRRIRPRSLEPFDFERANMSGELWFAEGFTNYYGLLVMERTGLTKPEQFFSSMGRGVNAVMTMPGRDLHTVVEMSELAPFVDAAKAVDENNFQNTFISYYIYGQALAFGIDLAIREQFPGKSLDDWMRVMWREHPDIDHPYTLADLQQTLAEATGSRAFADSIFREHVMATNPLDYAGLTERAGLVLRQAHAGQPALGIETPGGKSNLVALEAGGLRLESEPRAGSAFYEAGLSEGDIILRWDSRTAGAKGLKDEVELLAGHRVGDRIAVNAKTRAGEKKLAVTLQQDPQLELVTFETAGKPLTPEVRAFQKAWLSSKATHTLPKFEDGE